MSNWIKKNLLWIFLVSGVKRWRRPVDVAAKLDLLTSAGFRLVLLGVQAYFLSNAERPICHQQAGRSAFLVAQMFHVKHLCLLDNRKNVAILFVRIYEMFLVAEMFHVKHSSFGDQP